MPQAATEVCYLPLKPGTDLTSGDTGNSWSEVLSIINSQPGIVSFYWGRQVEHNDIVQLLITWDDISSHEKFIASPEYPAIGQRMGPHLAGAPHLYHVHLPPSFDAIQSAPVTECVSMYFKPSYDSSKWDADYTAFRKAVVEGAKGVHGMEGGWSVEEVKRQWPVEDGKEDDNGEKKTEEGPAKLFWAAIGWDSIDAHMAFRETQAFRDAIPLMRIPGVQVEMHHVKFQKV